MAFYIVYFIFSGFFEGIAAPIPQPKPFISSGNIIKTDKVRPGESVATFARRHGVPINQVIKINKLQRPYYIFIGQPLKIPAFKTASNRLQFTIIPGQKPCSLFEKNAVDLVENIIQPARKPFEQPSETDYFEHPPLDKPYNIGNSSSKITIGSQHSKKIFMWPVRGKIISTFGKKEKGLRNDGVNILIDQGTEIRAAENGVVAYAGNELRGFGNLILVKHGPDWLSAYAHTRSTYVKLGDPVKRGQVIATVGSSGNVKEPQLHFELRYKAKAVNPEKYLKK